MTWTHGNSTQASGNSTTPACAKPTGVSSGNLLWALVYTQNGLLNWPDGWIADGHSVDDGGAIYAWGHKVAGAEPSTYTWKCNTGSWNILLESFASTVQLDTTNIVDQYANVKASATATTLAGARPFEVYAGDLIIRWASSNSSASTTWPAGVTNLQNSNGMGDAWEVQASAGQATARTVTFGSSVTNRSETCAAYAALPPIAPTAHVLTGSGQISIASPVAIDIALTGLAGSLGTGKGNPTRYFQLGNIAWGTSLGFGRNYYLEHANEIVVAPFATCTLLAYSFAAGISATVTELITL
jgi:hypothetical protein